MSNAIETALAIAAKRTNTSPTEAQKAADSYAKGKVEIHGLPVNIENPKGSERSGVDKGGKRWSVKMPAHYGEVRGTEGKDGDPVDVYIGSDHASKKVFVVDQVDARTGKFDEHKAMLSYASKADALADYRKAFSDGKANDRIGAVTEMTTAAFRDWLKSGNTKKPLADSSKSGRDTPMARDTKSTASALAVARRFATGGAVRGYADGGMTDSFMPEPPISDGDDGVKASIAAYRPELAIGRPSKPPMPTAPLPPAAQTEYVYVTKHPKGHKQHRALDGKFRSDPKVEIARRAGGAVTRPSFDVKSALGKARIAKADGGEVKPRREAELNQWDPPWYDRLPHKMTDLIYGDNAGPQQGADTKKLFGTANPMNLPGQVAEGATRMRGGYDRGDYGEMAGGALEAAGGLLPAVGAAGVAGRLGPSARQTMRENRAWEANTPSGRRQAERANELASANERAKSLAVRDAAELKGVENALSRTKDPAEKAFLADLAKKMRAGEKVDVEDIAYAGHIEQQNASGLQLLKRDLENPSIASAARIGASVGGGAALTDYAWNTGVMPWSWNEPGTLQREMREFYRGKNPVRHMMDAYRNLDEQKVDTENQKGGFYGVDDKFPADRVDRANRTERSMGGGVDSALAAAKKYATGGSVHIGPVMGATGGRADELPISVPSGSFVVPADVVSSLGEGNTTAGMEKLQRQFTHSGTGRANGGAVPVPIKISDGEFVISPEDVAAIGGGDMAKGHKALDAMMVKLRKDHIKTLATLPPPSK